MLELGLTPYGIIFIVPRKRYHQMSYNNYLMSLWLQMNRQDSNQHGHYGN